MSPAAAPFPLPDSYERVRYAGSLTRFHGHVFAAEECSCLPPRGMRCDGFELTGYVGDRHVTMRHVRVTSFDVLAGAVPPR